ncbi:sensor domain-containing diguanylate cyclase [Dickeya dadantii]|uniref:diguanylate cyclase domain-containing protein n=1 Tax=Dickeya dadantii TaxID=204038 RepID=UPI000981BFA8|nr:diguanylate cyclase [Dickeya dadantii]NPE52629.1 diguanylate cyclase [Dickeya dadantii]OOC11763.1 sensor domain-containing diguanylate cyclase [Dickeya dadantii]
MTSPCHRCSEEQQDILARMLNIFDTQPAEELPRLTRITRTFFQVKSVVISLVNNERQWFLSKANFPFQEPAIEFSFCVHTVSVNAPLVIPDTLQDPRFATNPLVTGDEPIRFHAGYPLRSSLGTPLGALCLYHDQPRAFSDEDMQQLSDLAFIVQTVLHKVEMQAREAIAQERLYHSDYISQQIFSRAAIGLALIAPDKRPLKFNHAFCDMLDYDEETLLTLPVDKVVHPEDMPQLISDHNLLMDNNLLESTQQRRYIRADGSELWAQVSISVLYNPDGAKFGLLLALTDLSDQKASEQALRDLSQELEHRVEQRTAELRQSHQFIQDITDHIPAMISCINPNNVLVFANRHLRKLIGFEHDSLYQRDIHEILRPQELALFLPRLEESRQKRHPASFEHVLDMPDGQLTTFHTELVPADSPELGTYILSTDITHLTVLRDQLTFEANHDHLTGLPNRRAVISYLNRLAGKKRRGALALLFFDINNFKHYNDQFGHDFGDRVIKTFARLLRQNTRSYDFIGRLAGDEFLMVIHEQRNLANEIRAITQKLKAKFEKPITIRQQTITLSASVGRAILPQGAPLNANELIRQADTAMYQAKRRHTSPS